MNHNPQKIPRVSPYEIWYYSAACSGMRYRDAVADNKRIFRLSFYKFEEGVSKPSEASSITG